MGAEQWGSASLATRAADADREQTVAALRAHCVAGRLTLEELAARSRAAYDARTRGELVAVTHDLPGTPPVSATPPPARVQLRAAARWTVACLSSETRRGRWRLDGHSHAVALLGSCSLDLRQVTLDGPEIVISAYAFMGSVDIIVPEGVEVDMSGFTFMGSKECRVNDQYARPGAPVIRIEGYAFLASICVRSRSAPRTLAAGALL